MNWGDSELTQRTKPPDLATFIQLKIRWSKGPTQPDACDRQVERVHPGQLSKFMYREGRGGNENTIYQQKKIGDVPGVLLVQRLVQHSMFVSTVCSVETRYAKDGKTDNVG